MLLLLLLVALVSHLMTPHLMLQLVQLDFPSAAVARGVVIVDVWMKMMQKCRISAVDCNIIIILFYYRSSTF